MMNKVTGTIALFSAVLLLPGFGGCFMMHATVPDPVDRLVAGARQGDPARTRIDRIILDFNNDGLDDMAVTKSSLADEGERRWEVYLNRGGGRYAPAGSIRFNPASLLVEPVDRGMTRIVAAHQAPGKMIRSEYILSKKLRRAGAKKAVSGQPGTTVCNLYTGQVESCLLSEYLTTKNCLWKRRRPG